MAEIEEASVTAPLKFNCNNNLHYYKKSHVGMYKLLKKLNYNVDYVSVKTPELFEKYKCLYFPYHTMLDGKITPFLERFLERGGTVIADEGFGLRELNTWMRIGDIDLPSLMSARLCERRNMWRKEEYVDILGEKTPIFPFKSEISAHSAEAVSSFANGEPAIQLISSGNGKIYLSGIALGYIYHEAEAKGVEKLIEQIMSSCGIEKYKFADFKDGIYEKRLASQNETIVFIFNNSEHDKSIELDSKIIAFGADAIVDESKMTVKSGEIGYAVVNKSH